ncbi:tRNA lysidine(34) synthetase TilS (plasmid) [Radiobacillus kanasensis]|uniref:tRNA lysidine(34) synthetase TilS n=1 Tax=Radiobacillus kanasensis TaxID=2844358 RepID=UPI001E4B142A|nr:tRNA lysidine(34) synthetase TilS [Radiobacillus kanasensis]UFU01489.1 tRNA lysidine(34) synthetase TilS [Radiobacillus kanasensis]
MRKAVESFVKKNQLLHKGATVLVGVSGGPDSMALLHVLNSLQKTWQLRLIALSVDHGLRGDQSKQDVAYVRDMCSKWNIECNETYVDVRTYKEKEGKGTQVAARELRYKYFQDQMEVWKADYLALGHHGDDQVETIMMRLAQRTDPASLTGIPIQRTFANGRLIRPLLCVNKEEIEAYCREQHIEPRRDPSNQEDVYTRNYIRLHILPLLKQMNPSLSVTVQKLTERIADDEDYLLEEAKKVLDEAVIFERNTIRSSINIEKFGQFPIALQRRAYHLILNYLYRSVPKDLSYIQEEQLFELIENRPNKTIHLPGGLIAVKAYDRVNLYFQSELEQSEQTSYSYSLPVPGRVILPDGSMMKGEVVGNATPKGNDKFVCDPQSVELPIHIRTRKLGDKIRLKGLNGSRKLKDIFIDEKIPLAERDTWPVVTDATGTILWLPGLKKSSIERANDSLSTEYLQLEYIKNSSM